MLMKLLDIERDARDNGQILMGVAHVGHKNLTGSLISCAVGLDYTAISPDLIEHTLNGVYEESDMADIKKAIKVVHMHELTAIQLNNMADTAIAIHWADYHALYGGVFEVFHRFSCDPDVIISETPIKEVIKNQDLSLYTNKDSKSSYVVMDDWNQFNNLIPNTKFYTYEPEKSFTLLFAKAFANTRLQATVKAQKKKYNEYDFGMENLTEEQSQFLLANGLTEFHRAYLPELSNFVFKKHILI